MIKRLERLKNTVNNYMADLRPTSQNGSWSVKKLALTSPASGGRSLGVVHTGTQTTELLFCG
jgi:hypothetical protein